MIKLKILISVLLLVKYNCFSQKTNNECLQGKWEIIDAYLKEGEFRLSVFKKNKKLSVLSENSESSYNITYFGFISSDSLVNDSKLKLDFIKDSGSYFCTYDMDKESNLGINVNVLDRFYLSENCNEISYGNAKNYDGYRIDYIPYDKLANLPKNILVDFFNFKIINVNKSIISEQPNQPTKMYLLKNDSVEVIEEKDNWLKIIYYPEKNGEWTGKIIEGWIKRSDVE
jgi:hypothetical protein